VSTDLFDRLGVNGRDIIAGQASEHVLVTRPSHFKGLGWLARLDAGTVLLVFASILLAANAAAMGIVSWHAQYAFVLAEKHQHLASGLEALGLDTAAVIFAIYGIALARLGRRALIERVLVVVCALASCGMNLLGADLGSPRSVAVFVMPALLFAAGADRLIAVIRRAALGRLEDDDSQRSAWRVGGRAALYVLRFALAPPSTASGARRALLLATPLPAAEPRKAIPQAPDNDSEEDREPREGTKTAALLALVAERYGPLAEFPLDKVSATATELASDVRLHPGSARTALRRAVLAAQAGGAK
jgi:hypothetical protein